MSDHKYNIFDAVKDLVKGDLEFATDEVATERINICYDCEIRHEPTNVCTACGCFLPAKVKLLKSVCPLEKW